MNRHRRRPLKLHLRAAPRQRLGYRSSPKLSLKIILAGVLLALIMAAALGFAAVALLKNARMKHQGHAPSPSPSATALVAGTVNPVPTTLASPPVPSVSARPAPSVPANSVLRPTATPVLRPTAAVKDRAPQEVKTPSEAARKSAEQRRREAERKRARLETQYRNHEISDEAYKKGQKEYQAEMAKYRSVVGAAASANGEH
jgi:type IV secretory pathway VirB10-like protein